MISFSKIVVVDTEWTCWEGDGEKQERDRELIEIGVCLLSTDSLKISKPRRIFVKNEKSEVSEFCTKLTGITQEILNEKGKSLWDAICILKDEYKVSDRVWAGWGNERSDIVGAGTLGMFQATDAMLSRTYLDVMALFSLVQRSPNRIGLDRALRIIDEEFDGDRHTAGWDAYNAAKVLRWILRRSRE